jgi:hypothetical protein
MGGNNDRNYRVEGRLCGRRPSSKEPRHELRHFRRWALCLNMKKQWGKKILDPGPPAFALEREGCCAEPDEAILVCVDVDVRKEHGEDSEVRNEVA